MMKRNILFCSLLAALLLSACSNNTPASGAGSSSQPVQEVSLAEEESDGLYEGPEFDEPPLVVADAAMYRGTVVDLQEEEDGLLLTLEQAEGTDFGHDQLQVRIDENTRRSFEQDAIAAGGYLEVYYGAPMGAAVEQPVTAIAVNRLPEAEMSIFNGALVSIEEDEQSGAGTMLLEALEGEESILFHYDESTQFYLNLEELAEGDRLNVYFSGITTRSIPPQATALEVRLYK